MPPSFTREQIAHVLDDADVEWVLTDQAERFVREQPMFAYVSTSHRTGLALLRRESRRSDALLCASDIGKVTYTSGSTGAPKGVCLQQAAIQSVTDSLVAATAGLGVRTHLCLPPHVDYVLAGAATLVGKIAHVQHL